MTAAEKIYLEVIGKTTQYKRGRKKNMGRGRGLNIAKKRQRKEPGNQGKVRVVLRLDR